MNSKLIILHGWTYSTTKWKPFLKLLKAHNVEYEMLKIPGLTAPLGSIWTLDDYISWLERITKDEERITLLGHSNGGRIAAAFAATFPEEVSHLILIDSAGVVHKDLKTQLKKFVFGSLSKIGKRVIRSNMFRNLLYEVIGEKDYNRADPVMKKTMVNLISKDLTQEFGQITIPTLIIWGKNDKVTPPSDAKKINNLVSGSRLEIIDDARHSPQFSHPKEVVSMILNFISK